MEEEKVVENIPMALKEAQIRDMADYIKNHGWKKKNFDEALERVRMIHRAISQGEKVGINQPLKGILGLSVMEWSFIAAFWFFVLFSLSAVTVVMRSWVLTKTMPDFQESLRVLFPLAGTFICMKGAKSYLGLWDSLKFFASPREYKVADLLMILEGIEGRKEMHESIFQKP